MKYINAAEILPEQLLREIQTYIAGEVMYIPKTSTKKQWGTVSGSRAYYQERNTEIQNLYKEGYSLTVLSQKYGLAYSTIRKIVYG